MDHCLWRQAECDRFYAEVEDLLVEMTREMGEDFEIIIEQRPLQEDSDLDAYLQNPNGFRRAHPG
jgi:hypothetical protein